MTNNLTSVIGGFGVGVSQDSSLEVAPYGTLIVAPQSNATSATVPASAVTQRVIPAWVSNTSGLPTYILEDPNPTLWALTFPVTTTYQGTPVCVLDCLRNVTLTFSTATTNDTTVTIDGWDDRGVEVVWTSASQAAGITSVVSTKCFKIIRNVSFTAYPWAVNSSTNTVLVRGGTFIGLPNFINTATSVISAVWAGATALTAVVPGANWRQTSVTPPINAATSVPTATSSDARGYVNITGLTAAPNGALILHVCYYVYGVDDSLNKKLSALNGYTSTGEFKLANDPGSVASIVLTKNGASGKPMLTSLVRQDRFGAQFPGDATFMEYYNGLYYKV